MKFKILRNKFIESMKSVQNIVVSKGSLNILQNVLMEARDNRLFMTTTDLDISISASVECEVIESGKTTLPMRLLFNSIAKAAEGEVEVEVDSKDRATIKAGSAKFKIVGMSENEYPKLPEDDDSYAYSVGQSELKNMLRKVSYAASQDDTRKTLKGVLMSFNDMKLTMVATDGRRMALIENELEFPHDMEKDIVLPSKTVQELIRSLNGDQTTKIRIQKSQISFETENMILYSKLIDEVYPNYRQVIPGEIKEKISVDRQQLLDALDRASVMTMDEAHSIKLIFSENKLTVTSAVSDVGEAKDEVEIKYAGEPIEIIFNPSYVMDPLKAIDDDEITINLNNGHSPAVIKSSEKFLYVLMPLRIN